VLGVGSDLRGDDAAGMLIALRLQEFFKDRLSPSVFRVFAGETAPENFTGELKKFRPSHLLITDCADFGKAPGEAVLATPEEITGISFSTHRLPLFVLTDYILQAFPCAIQILGIQPATLELLHEVTEPVQKTVECLTGMLIEAIQRPLSARLPSARGNSSS
jgi:hydrogenase 3 maturation protease